MFLKKGIIISNRKYTINKATIKGFGIEAEIEKHRIELKTVMWEEPKWRR